jgi:hypothetical protein
MLQNGVGCKTIRTGRHTAQHLRQTPLKQLKKLNHCASRIGPIPDRVSFPSSTFEVFWSASARLPARKNAAGFVSMGVSACEAPDAIARTKASGHISLKFDIASSLKDFKGATTLAFVAECCNQCACNLTGSIGLECDLLH